MNTKRKKIYIYRVRDNDEQNIKKKKSSSKGLFSVSRKVQLEQSESKNNCVGWLLFNIVMDMNIDSISKHTIFLMLHAVMLLYSRTNVDCSQLQRCTLMAAIHMFSLKTTQIIDIDITSGGTLSK